MSAVFSQTGDSGQLQERSVASIPLLIGFGRWCMLDEPAGLNCGDQGLATGIGGNGQVMCRFWRWRSVSGADGAIGRGGTQAAATIGKFVERMNEIAQELERITADPETRQRFEELFGAVSNRTGAALR